MATESVVGAALPFSQPLPRQSPGQSPGLYQHTNLPEYQEIQGHEVNLPEYQEIEGNEVIFDQDEEGRRFRLGEGSFGTTYRGEYRKLGRTKVVIKRIRQTEYGIEERVLKRLKQESRRMYKVRCPDILTVFGFVSDTRNENDQIFGLVAEFMERGSLKDMMEMNRVPWEVKVKMLDDVTRGLVFLCTPQGDRDYQIIHGDIKAANVLVDVNLRAKIADYGIKGLQKITKTVTRIPYKETPTHVAPELLYYNADDIIQPSEVTDVWSFGITVFEACAEIKPNPRQPNIYDRVPFPAGLTERGIFKMLHRDMQPLFTPLQKQKVPESCPDFLYRLCQICSTVDPTKRPKFDTIQKYLHDNFHQYCRATYNGVFKTFYELLEGRPPPPQIVRQMELVTNPLSPVEGRPLPPQIVRQMELVSEPISPVEERSSEPATPETNTVQEELRRLVQRVESMTRKIDLLSEQNSGQFPAESDRNTRTLLEEQSSKSLQISLLREQMAQQHQLLESLQQKQEPGSQQLSSSKTQQISQIEQQMQQHRLLLEQIQQNQHLGFERIHSKLGEMPTRHEMPGIVAAAVKTYEYREPLIADNFEYLVENVASGKVSSQLNTYGILDEADLESIDAKVTEREKVEVVLRKVDHQGMDAIGKLISALNSSGDRAYVGRYLSERIPMLTLRTHWKRVREWMKPQEVVPRLYSQGILSLTQRQAINAEVTDTGKTERLMNTVYRLGPEAYSAMLRALSDSGQQEVVNVLTADQMNSTEFK